MIPILRTTGLMSALAIKQALLSKQTNTTKNKAIARKITLYTIEFVYLWMLYANEPLHTVECLYLWMPYANESLHTMECLHLWMPYTNESHRHFSDHILEKSGRMEMRRQIFSLTAMCDFNTF